MEVVAVAVAVLAVAVTISDATNNYNTAVAALLQEMLLLL